MMSTELTEFQKELIKNIKFFVRNGGIDDQIEKAVTELPDDTQDGSVDISTTVYFGSEKAKRRVTK
jgi:hypothetical protein